MADRIAADRWTLNQFLDKAREIRRRLLRWHESLPLSVGMEIQYEGQKARVVSWDEHAAVSGETFRFRLNPEVVGPIHKLKHPYEPDLNGPVERGGELLSDVTEYLLLDFWEHLSWEPALELLRVAFGAVLDLHPFVVQPLGTVRGNTIAPGDIEPGKTLWTVAGSKIDPQILNDLVEAAERLSGPPTGKKLGGPAVVVELEWSKPVGYRDLRTALGIAHNTLKARLVDSVEPVVGKIRYKAPPKAHKIQVVVSDLPADLQTRLRRTGKQTSN